MNFRRVFFIRSIIIAFAVFLPVPVLANDRWISVRSQNFQLSGNASEAEMRAVAEKLEQFRFVFTHLFSELKFNSPISTNVIVFKDEASLLPFKPLTETGQAKDWVKGFFLPDKDVNYIVLSADKNSEGNFTTIFHEYVHFLIDNTLGRSNIPPWLNEGLAEYYEQFQIDKNGQVTLGKTDKSHILLLQKNGFMPFEKFFAIDYYTLHRQPKEKVIAYYAQAWALTHYLIHEKKEAGNRRKRFPDFIINGKSANNALSEIVGTDYISLENKLRKYVAQKNFDVSVSNVGLNDLNANSFKTSPVSEAEAKAFQGDLLLRANRSGEAQAFLMEALSLDAELGFANASLGLLKIKENNLPEAKKYLEKAIRNDSRNYFTFFTYAYVLSREGMTDFGFVINYDAKTAETIRENLRRAIALNPNFAESYQLFAFVNVVRNEDLEEGIEMIEKALEIAPGNENYNLRKAELLMRKHDFSNARTITGKILQTATEEKSKLYALNTLNLINNWEAQLKEIEENKKRPRKIEDEPEKFLTEEEIQKLNARAMLESLNQALRRPFPNEKRVLGYLSNIDCEAKIVNYSVKLDDKIVRFKSTSVEDVYLRSFEANLVNSQFGCGFFNDERLAVITFRPNNADSSISGELTAIEFVPKTFVFLDVSKIVTKTHF